MNSVALLGFAIDITLRSLILLDLFFPPNRMVYHSGEKHFPAIISACRVLCFTFNFPNHYSLIYSFFPPYLHKIMKRNSNWSNLSVWLNRFLLLQKHKTLFFHYKSSIVIFSHLFIALCNYREMFCRRKALLHLQYAFQFYLSTRRSWADDI